MEENKENIVEETVVEEKKDKKVEKAAKDELKKLRHENVELKKELETAETKAKDAEDKYLRCAAEYDNFRKRSAKERDGIYSDAISDSVKNLLPIIDNLQLASMYSEGDKVVEGVKMILNGLPGTLEKMNVTQFGEKGEQFDPNLHNAVMHVDDEAYGENEIVEVLQKGYKHGDKVIRYAMVKVAN